MRSSTQRGHESRPKMDLAGHGSHVWRIKLFCDCLSLVAGVIELAISERFFILVRFEAEVAGGRSNEGHHMLLRGNVAQTIRFRERLPALRLLELTRLS